LSAACFGSRSCRRYCIRRWLLRKRLGSSGAAGTISAMSQNFIGCDRDQELLLPPSLREWLPEGHLAWFVLDTVEQMDLSPFYGDYRLDGHASAASWR
jgi:hypothetical protein